MNSKIMLLTFEVFKIPDDPRIERLRERPAYYNAEGTLPQFNKPVYELTKPQWATMIPEKYRKEKKHCNLV